MPILRRPAAAALAAACALAFAGQALAVSLTPAPQSMSEQEANQMSMRVELQADCFAGVWGHFTQQKGLLEQGDIEEALNAAQQIGDDTLQKKMQGYVVPESFNHGTSEQRARWFAKGLRAKGIKEGDTFNAREL